MASVTLTSRCINPTLPKAPFASEPNSGNTRDDDFSLYFSLIREKFPPELANSVLDRSSIRVSLGRKRNDDGELDIFTADKYFSGEMDQTGGRQSFMGESEAGAKPRSDTGNTWSESGVRGRQRWTRKGKGLLGVLRCPCSRKDAVDVEKGCAEDPISSKKTDPNGEMGCQGMEKMSFGGLSPGAGRVADVGDFGSVVLNPAVAGGRGGGGTEVDEGSEGSSDLFEIDSISLKAHRFSQPEKRESSSRGYEPSEASIKWSGATASAANFSVVSEGNKTSRQHRPGILLGCVSEKAVEIKEG